MKNNDRTIKVSEVTNKLSDGDFGDEDQRMPKKPLRSDEESKSKTPTLDAYTIDLTKKAAENKLDNIIGRDKEMDSIMRILTRRKKNNPIILGDAGCIDYKSKIVVRKISNTEERIHNLIIVE